jgi:anaerobic selenocysteine-containing dehydrogenase
MNLSDMNKLGLNNDDKIRIESEIGIIDRFTVQAFDIAEGGVLGYYPEVNPLIGLTRDPRSQTPAFKSVPVNIIKVDHKLT